jgi:hypothetical protein
MRRPAVQSPGEPDESATIDKEDTRPPEIPAVDDEAAGLAEDSTSGAAYPGLIDVDAVTGSAVAAPYSALAEEGEGASIAVYPPPGETVISPQPDTDSVRKAPPVDDRAAADGDDTGGGGGGDDDF